MGQFLSGTAVDAAAIFTSLKLMYFGGTNKTRAKLDNCTTNKTERCFLKFDEGDKRKFLTPKY